MRLISLATALMLSTGIANAGLLDGLRELGGTIGEVTRTNKQVGDLFKSISTVSNGQVGSAVALPKDAEGSVILYRTDYCGYCKQAASYMQQKAIPFIEKDIQVASNEAEYKALGGGRGVPFMVFGQKTMEGFSTQAIDANYAEFQRTKSAKVASGASASGGNLESSVIKSGDVITPKVDKIKILKDSNKKSAKLAQASKSDSLIYMGEEQNGLYKVTTSEGNEGWVDKLLVKKQ